MVLVLIHPQVPCRALKNRTNTLTNPNRRLSSVEISTLMRTQSGLVKCSLSWVHPLRDFALNSGAKPV